MPAVDPCKAVRGQYVGYRDIEGVRPDSDTETFVALQLEIENWRWAGVPILVRAGKALPRTATEIVVRLQRVPQLRWGAHRLDSPGLRRHRPSHRAAGGHVDLRAREDSRQGGLAAGLARPRLRRGARRAAAARTSGCSRTRFAATGRSSRAGSVIEETWRIVQPLLDDPPPDRAVRAAARGGPPRRMRSRAYGGWREPQ